MARSHPRQRKNQVPKAGKAETNTRGEDQTETPLTGGQRQRLIKWFAMILLLFVLSDNGRLRPRNLFELRLGFGGPRAPIAESDERAVLVMGSMSSGTSELTRRLSRIGLEVSHERSDASFIYCRDGTVSWIHGMRFLAPTNVQERAESMCAVQRPIVYSVFHYTVPMYSCYGLPSIMWTSCWKQVCLDSFTKNLGCDPLVGGAGCPTNYENYILSARYPLYIVTSLTARWCQENGNAHYDTVNTPYKWEHLGGGILNRFDKAHLVHVIRALFPTPKQLHDPETLCGAFVAWYVVAYYEEILRVLPDIPIVQVENDYTSCQIAHQIGFTSPSCRNFNLNEISGTVKNPQTHGSARRNIKGLVLDWTTVSSWGDEQLVLRLKQLTSRLGYEI